MQPTACSTLGSIPRPRGHFGKLGAGPAPSLHPWPLVPSGKAGQFLPTLLSGSFLIPTWAGRAREDTCMLNRFLNRKFTVTLFTQTCFPIFKKKLFK